MTTIRIAAGLCFLAVALGAFGAHSLRSTLEQHGMSDVWNKAVRALWYDQSRRLVATPCGDTPFQREPVRHGINKYALARICYSPGRALFPCRLGLVNYRTNKVIMVEPAVSAAFVPGRAACSKLQRGKRTAF